MAEVEAETGDVVVDAHKPTESELADLFRPGFDWIWPKPEASDVPRSA